jgi:hypothetical protein
LIKSISDYYGGDDAEWLREYAIELITTNKEDLGKAIICLESICIGLEIKHYSDSKKKVIIDLCKKCKYRPLFCRCF